MFTPEQIKEIATKLNSEIDIPWIPEAIEQEMFELLTHFFSYLFEQMVPLPFRALFNEKMLVDMLMDAFSKHKVLKK